jgi:hypothetical protein
MAANPTLVQRIDAFAAAIGTDVKTALALISDLQADAGDISQLNTTAKNTFVAALNELKAGLDGIDITDLINDNATDTAHTWSSTKISAYVSQAIAQVIDGADGALNTLKELADALQNNPNIIQGLIDGMAKRVRVDAPQNFTLAEQLQGRQNIGAASDAEFQDLSLSVGGIGASNFVQTYTNAKNAA